MSFSSLCFAAASTALACEAVVEDLESGRAFSFAKPAAMPAAAIAEIEAFRCG